MRKPPSKPAAREAKHADEAERRRLADLLDKGIADLEAGRVVSADEVRRIVDRDFAERAVRRAAAHKK